jgi:hypothetical protein
MGRSFKDSILNLRSEGKTYKEIKEELGCSIGTISYHCSKGDNRALDKELVRQIKEYYNKGNSSIETSEKFNVAN